MLWWVLGGAYKPLLLALSLFERDGDREVQIKSASHSGEKRPVRSGAIREGFKKEMSCEQSVGGWLSHSHLEGTRMDPTPGVH